MSNRFMDIPTLWNYRAGAAFIPAMATWRLNPLVKSKMKIFIINGIISSDLLNGIVTSLRRVLRVYWFKLRGDQQWYSEYEKYSEE